MNLVATAKWEHGRWLACLAVPYVRPVWFGHSHLLHHDALDEAAKRLASMQLTKNDAGHPDNVIL